MKGQRSWMETRQCTDSDTGNSGSGCIISSGTGMDRKKVAAFRPTTFLRT